MDYMTKIRLKQIERINASSELKSGDVFSYDSVKDEFNTKYSISNSLDEDSLPVRDVNGNIQIGDAVADKDAVNLETLNKKVLGTTIIDSDTIKAGIDEESGKTILTVIPSGISGNIQKNLNNELASCSYLFEDTSKKSIEIARSEMFKASSPENPLLLLTHVKAKSDYDSDLVFDVSSFDTSYGCNLKVKVARQTSNNDLMISRDSLYNGQSMLKLSVDGYTSVTESKTAFEFEVKSASNFADSVSSTFSLKQSIDGISTNVIQSDSAGNIFLSSGLRLSNSSYTSSGMMRFDGSHFQGYKDGSWVNLDVQSTEGTALSEDVTVTLNCGGYKTGDIISTGTTFDDLVKQLLAPYVQPTFFDFTIIGLNSGEEYPDMLIGIGNEFIPSNAIVSCTEDSDGNFATSCKISGDGFDDVSFTPSSSSQTIDASSQEAVVYNTPTEAVWTVSGQDKNGNDVSAEYKIKWVYTAFFGASSETISDISSLQQMQYITDGTVEFLCTSDNANENKTTYLALPAEYVDNKTDLIIRRNCLNVTGAFTKSEVSYMTQSGNSIDYILYSSNAKGAFASGNRICIK